MLAHLKIASEENDRTFLFTGVLTSPNFPNDYPANLEKSYSIEVEQGKILLLAFTVFNIDSATDNSDYYEYNIDYVTCPSDHLSITDGDGTMLLEEACGHLLPASITSKSNNVSLFFRTDDTSSKAGWSLIWSTVTPGLAISFIFLLDNHNFVRVPRCIPWQSLHKPGRG